MISIPLTFDFVEHHIYMGDLDGSVEDLTLALSNVLEIFSVLELDKSLWRKGTQQGSFL